MIRTGLIALTALSVTACNAANLTSVYRQPSLENGRSVVLDAEQFVLVNRNGQTCVMPSPDGLASVGASGSLLGEIAGQGGASGSASVSESAAYIGLRTQSIQLLRDTLFSLCLQAQNGQIDEFSSAILMRRYQSQLVAVLAVEQLTGTVSAGGGSTFTAAASSPGDFVLALTSASSDISQRQSQISTRLSQISTELADSPTPARRTALEEEQSRLQQEQSDLSSAGDIVSEALSDLEAGNSSSAGAALSRAAEYAPNVFESGDSEAIAAVAQSVENIVDGFMRSNNANTLCFEYFRTGPQTAGYRPHAETDLSNFCNAYLARLSNPTMDRLVGQYVGFISEGRYNEAAALYELIELLQTGEVSDDGGSTVYYAPVTPDDMEGVVMTPYPG